MVSIHATTLASGLAALIFLAELTHASSCQMKTRLPDASTASVPCHFSIVCTSDDVHSPQWMEEERDGAKKEGAR